MRKLVALFFVAFVLLLIFSGCKTDVPIYEPNPASDFEYELNSDGSGVFIKKYVGTKQDVVIPSHIENLPVLSLKGVPHELSATAISEGVFQGSNIKSVVIPETVEAIRGSAFADCEALTSVTFLSNSQLTYVAGYAFANCKTLENIDFSETQLQSIGVCAFRGCTALKTIELSNTLEQIGERAFYECSSLSEIKLPQSLTKMEGDAFGYCTSLSRIVIPANVNLNFFSAPAFHHISSFIEIEFEEGREAIVGYALLQTPSDVKIMVPKSVKQFSPLTFLITPTAEVSIIFYGDAPEIVEETTPDWFGTPTVYYDSNTSGWDAFEWKGRFEMLTISEK